MDRRSRFSPDPVLQSLRARAVSQPPRSSGSSGTTDYAVFAFPETSTISSNRSAQSPVRDRPWGQRLGRSPAAVSRVPQLRSASFSATAHPPENEIWPHGGGHFPSTFEEDDEESLDAWTDNFHGQPRSWANSDSRFRSQNPGARSRSLVATLTNPLPIGQGLSPTGGLSNDWNEAPLSHSIDQRFLSGHPTRINGSRAQSLQSTASMPAALAGMRGSHAEISNLSPFVRDPLGPRIVQEDISNGYDPWNSYMGTMREEEPGSGTNSRRHSVSVVQPRVRGIGFAATATNAAPTLDDAPSSRLNAALGRSIFSDEELAGDFNLLNLGNNSMHSNGHGVDLHPSGATSYPHSVPRLNPQTHTRFKPNGGLQAPSGYAPLDTHLLSNRTPSDGRSPINDGGFPLGKAAHLDQFGATLAHVGHGRGSSPLGSLRSREASPVRHDRTPDYSPINPQVNEGPYGPEHIQPSHGPAIHEPVQGLSIDELPQTSRLVLVEFKLNRKEIFYCDASLKVKAGDRLIVEGDRGKDIGTVVDPDVEKHWANSQRRDGSDIISSVGSRPKAKRAYAVAGPQESLDLAKKEEDEQKALQLCQNKVRQKKLPMQVVDCEFQWDRRKLTFYFIAESRIDFRDLVRELFRLYKTRIWMSCVSGPLAGPTGNIVY